MQEIIVYTAIFGNKPFDRLKDFNRDWLQEADFLCFTNLPIKSDKWKIIHVPLIRGMDPRLMARKVKILSHVYLPDHKYSLWLDASVELLESPKKIMETYMKETKEFFYEG